METHSNIKTLTIIVGICLAVATGAFAQAPAPASGQVFSDRLQRVINRTDKPEEGPKFNLDFPCGGPKGLVVAIEKASGKPPNVIVPAEYEGVQLPPMKLTGVTVPAVFQALTMASRKTVWGPGYNFETSYTFETRGEGENAVWYFHTQFPPEPARYCRFYQLADFLEAYKIEDITTAIKTGWGLIGVKVAPELKFHPETKLLIAVGSTDELQTIESVLQELRKVVGPRTSSGFAMPSAPGVPAGIQVRPPQPLGSSGSPAKNDGASTKK